MVAPRFAVLEVINYLTGLAREGTYYSTRFDPDTKTFSAGDVIPIDRCSISVKEIDTAWIQSSSRRMDTPQRQRLGWEFSVIVDLPGYAVTESFENSVADQPWTSIPGLTERHSVAIKRCEKTYPERNGGMSTSARFTFEVSPASAQPKG